MARSGAQSYRYQFDNLPEDRWEGVFDLDFEALLHSVEVRQFASGQKFALSHANLKRAIEEQKEKYREFITLPEDINILEARREHICPSPLCKLCKCKSVKVYLFVCKLRDKDMTTFVYDCNCKHDCVGFAFCRL